MTALLHQVYGKVVKVGGLMGRPDLLFVYDADEIEKVKVSSKRCKLMSSQLEVCMYAVTLLSLLLPPLSSITLNV